MYSIVDEKRISPSLSKYKLSDGNIVDTTWVRQNIHLVDNVKIYQNGKIAWGILTSDTEENKFYASLCNIYYRLGCDLGIIKNIFVKYEELNQLIQPSKQEEKFKSNLYNIIQMFFSYMTDTNYTFCKIRCKKTFASGSKDDLIYPITKLITGFATFQISDTAMIISLIAGKSFSSITGFKYLSYMPNNQSQISST